MRKLVAAFACRVGRSRLYGKPLQNLDFEQNITVLDQMLDLTETITAISSIVIGVAEGHENSPLVDFAKNRNVDYIIGNEEDVLFRLIMCGRKAQATDVFRVTTENPFFHYEMVDEAWTAHVEAGNDVTVIDGLPEGCFFEIFSMKALDQSHKLGDSKHRSEYCSLYIREHLEDFQVGVLPIPQKLERMDMRLTIDYPEDLVLCRRVYSHFKHLAPRIPVDRIIDFLDENPEIQSLVEPYVDPVKLW